MSAKAEISWVRTNEEGEKLRVYARHFGKKWRFFTRQRRYDQWQETPNPPLEDWLELLDSVRRRVVRRLYQPDDVARLEKMIHERFPEAKFD